MSALELSRSNRPQRSGHAGHGPPSGAVISGYGGSGRLLPRERGHSCGAGSTEIVVDAHDPRGAGGVLVGGGGASIYPTASRVGTTSLLCREDWIPGRPLDLSRVTLNWVDPPPAPAVTGTGPVSGHVRPLRADGTRYPTYADALAAIDTPALLIGLGARRADLGQPARPWAVLTDPEGNEFCVLGPL